MSAKENDLPRKNADGYYRKDITFRGRKYAVRSKTLKGLFTKLAEKKRMLEAGMLIPTENTYAADWCMRWLEEYQRPRCGHGQYLNYRANITRHIAPSLGRKRLCDVQPASPDALLFTQSRTGRMHSRTSMRCMWTSFKRELDIRAGAVVYRNQIVTHAIADDLVPYCLRRTFFYLKRKTIGKTDGFGVKSVLLCEV